jgi:hypothetical protein
MINHFDAAHETRLDGNSASSSKNTPKLTTMLFKIVQELQQVHRRQHDRRPRIVNKRCCTAFYGKYGLTQVVAFLKNSDSRSAETCEHIVQCS